MKKCVTCQKDIPDGAIHCVFCGAKQGAASLNPMPSAGAANQQKTIMGYAAADLAKFGIPVPGAAPPAAGGPPPPAAGPPPAAPPPSSFGAPPSAAAPPPASFGGPPPPAGPPEAQRTVMFGGGAPPPPMGGPPGFGPPPSGPPQAMGSSQPTMMAGAGGAAPPPPGPQLQVQSPHVLGGGAGAAAAPATARPSDPTRMSAPPKAQFVPSGDAPVEPWGGSFRLWMVLVGLGLIATTVAPWAGGDGKLIFSWTMLTAEGASKAFKIWPIVYGASGLLCLLLGLIPVPVGVRGIAGILLGAAAIVLNFVIGPLPFGGGGGGFGFASWAGYVVLAGFVLAPAGLLVSGQYPDAMFGRLIAFLGGACLIAPWVIPVDGALPIAYFFKSLGGGGGLRLANVWLAATMLLPGLFALLCIAKPIIASFWAWLIILSGAVGMLFSMILDPLVNGGFSLDGILREPITALIIIPTFAFPLLLTYGLATLIGKTLEP